MTEPYPIYSRENDDEIIGYTKVGDMAVVTHSDFKDDYHEVSIVSGKYTGVDTLALNNDDLYISTFVMNHIDDHKVVYVNGQKVNSECV
jgi:hypothetical protein